MAENLGIKDGSNAAEWQIQDLWGGRNTNQENCILNAKSVIDWGYEGAAMSSSRTPIEVADEVFWTDELDEDQESQVDELHDVYSVAFMDGFNSTLEKSALEFLTSIED